MPELPDIQIYLEALERFTVGKIVEDVRLRSPFLVRTVEPPLRAIVGQTVRGYRRLGKRIVFEFDDKLFVVLHLMIAGRLRWKRKGEPVNRAIGLAAFDFLDGSLMLTEAGKKRRASIHVVRGEAILRELDPGGVEPLECTLEEFREALLRENHTLKRTLTDPHLFAGIGNAYSDEILHRAKLSPILWTSRLGEPEIENLYTATRAVLSEWIARLRVELEEQFPDQVTAFRPEMSVHGRYGEPCPVCSSKVQRIRRAENEVNYCATCQTEGRLLADRSLSRLLKDDWPRTLEELEERRRKLALPKSGGDS